MKIRRLSPAEQRVNLTAAVEQLAIAIATGDVTPDPIELQALAAVCEDKQLPRLAARVRRCLSIEMVDVADVEAVPAAAKKP